MKLKTYVARNPQEALAQVRQDLGSEAFILSTQSRFLDGPGSEAGRQRRVEVTAVLGPEFPSSPGLPSWTVDSKAEVPAYFFEHFREELEELKAFFRQWLQESGPPYWLTRYPDLRTIYQLLLRAGIRGPLLHHWLEEIRTLVKDSPDAGPNLRKQALERLLKSLELVDPWRISAPGPIRWSFLGPSGVGKSTTLAKVAVRAAFMKKKRVGLICLNHGHLPASNSLAVFARVAGLPLKTVEHRQELLKALKNWEDLEVILVDTPGFNPREAKLSVQLWQLLGDIPELSHHLVLSSTTRESSLEDTIMAFRVLPLASAVVTKVDETRNFGNVVSQLYKHHLPLSFLTLGPRVPEDLKLANRTNLLGILLHSCNSHLEAKG
jgi:flagellar biosynthesis protein FlhF